MNPVRTAMNPLLAGCVALAGFFPAAAWAQIWDGGGTNDNWTTANNWNPNGVPVNNGTANIIFRGSVRLTPVVSTIEDVLSITFSSPAGAFNVNVGGFHTHLEIGAGGVTNNDNSTQTISAGIRTTAAQTWRALSGNLAFGVVDGLGNTLTIDGGFNTTINRITGFSSSLIKSGSGTLFLTGDGSSFGGITINAGTLSIDADSRLGGNDVVINGGALAITDDIGTLRDITLTAAGASLSGTAHQLVYDGGVLTVNGGGVSTASGFLGAGLPSNGAAIINGGGSSWTMTGSFGVGYQDQGTLSVEAGGDVSNAIAHIGSLPGSTGTATVTGAGSTWTSSGFLGVGYSGTGTLNIQDGGSVAADSSFVATDPGSVGHVDISGGGSSWSVNGSPVIGEHGTATMAISGGGSVTGSGGFIGRFADGNGDVTVSDPGSLWNTTGTLIIAGSGTGAMTVQAGGDVSNTSYCHIGDSAGASGTVTVTGAGSTWTNGDDLAVGFTGKGELNILAGGSVWDVDGSIGGASPPNDSAVVVGAGSTWTHSGNLTVGDGGTGSLRIEAGGGVTNVLGQVGRLINGIGTATVTGGGSTWTNDNLAVGYLSGNGTLNVQNGGHVSAANGSVGNSSGNGNATITGAGSNWNIPGALSVGFNGSGTLLIDEGASMSTFLVSFGFGSGSSATATVAGAGSLWTIGNEFQMSVSGATSVLNVTGGTMTLGGDITDGGSGVSTLTLDGGTLDLQNHKIGGATPINNLNFRSGTLRNVNQINNGAGLTKTTAGTLILNTANSYTGATAINGGILQVSNATGSATGTGALTVAGGARLRGTGRIGGTVQNNGFTAPGASAGTLTLLSTYSQSGGGSLDIEIGGTTAGTQYDRLAVTGAATLSGALNVMLINAFNPTAGQTFDVVTAGSIGGTFATVNLPSLPNVGSWEIQYLPGAVRLTVVACEPCDTNCDGSVNLFDIESFVGMLSNPGNGCSSCAADANSDGSINLFDIEDFVECLTG